MEEKNTQKMGPNEWIILDLIIRKSLQLSKPILVYYSASTNAKMHKEYVANMFPNEDIERIGNLNKEQYLGIPLIRISFDYNNNRYKLYTMSSYVKNNEIYKFILDNQHKIVELHDEYIETRNGSNEFKNKFQRIKAARNEELIELQEWASCVIKVLNAFIYTDKPKKSTTVNKFSESYFYRDNLSEIMGIDAINSIFSNVKKEYVDFYTFLDKCNEYYGNYIELYNQLFYQTSIKRNGETEFNRNRLIYGAPGTGKSSRLKRDARYLCKCSSLNEKDYITRVTFYPEYSYGQFVGSYKPVPIYSDEFENIDVFLDESRKSSIENPLKPYINYRVEPGPFLETLIKATNNKDKNYVLIVEEINRGNASAIFGDVFQLLDRDDNEESEYSIELSPTLMGYLKSKNITTVKLPSNLYIWATMNSSDENIEPIDAAFRRRWTLEYIDINENEAEADNWYISFPFLKSHTKFEKEKISESDRKIKWNTFRREINRKLINSDSQLEEDKLLGPFFLRGNEFNSDNVIKSKLVIYLYKELIRYGGTDSVFDTKYKSVNDLLEGYDSKERVFNFTDDELVKMINESINVIKSGSNDIVESTTNEYSNDEDRERQVAISLNGKEVADISVDEE
ncbi:AAA family ATPase [Clostridium swellfunianum]|uniref:McrB family protein n=1 Tax=Clostridium swellfunianum TaxID=1367462 RepID=UPI00203086F1|nr:AAA family ATPase [Clostridium swellfunianum]MCM0647248.1 AAA family ATPase [Clostridium swellfunianum]